MKIIQTNREALDLIYLGVNTAGNIVRSTLGPAGLNVGIGSKFLKPRITNDGFTVLKAIHLDDETQELAVRIVEDGVEKTNKEAGDATTTTTMLIQDVFNAGYERFDTSNSMIKKTPNAVALRNEINTEALKAIEQIKKEARQIKTLKDIEKVAYIAVEDKDLAKIIADVVFAVGKDGVIKVEEAGIFTVTSEISQGMEIHSGFMSSHMATNDKYEAVLDKPYVLIVKEKISSISDLSGIGSELDTLGIKELVIIAPDFNQSVINSFNYDIAQGKFRVLAIKANIWDTGILEDLCAITGATLIDSSNFASLNITNLGKVERVVSSVDKTVFIGSTTDTTKTIELVRAELKATKTPFEKQKIEERLARLIGKVAVISVGGLTEIDRGRLKDKIDDAVHATVGALEEGVVKGGGLTLKEVAEKLPKSILTTALLSPYRQIQENTGGIEITDDIIDSAKSIRLAIESACNTAGNLLTLGTTIAEKNESDPKQDN